MNRVKQEIASSAVDEIEVVFKQVGRQGGHGALAGEGMTGKGEVLDHVIDLVGELFQHLLDIALQTRTIRSLVITKYGNGDRRIGRPLQRQA